MIRTIAVVCCAFLLCTSLVGANAVLALDRGPMNPDHMTDSLEEAGFYTFMSDEVSSMLLDEIGDDAVDGVDLAVIVEDVVSPEFVKVEVERNTDAVYAYLSGDSDQLILTLDSSSLQEATATAIQNDGEGLDYGAVGLEELNQIVQSENAYEETRSELRTEFLLSVGVDPDQGFGNAELAAMIADAQQYETVRQSLQEDIVDGILDSMEADSGFGHEQLEQLLSSEASYDTSQTEFREEQKAIIQEETPQEHSDAELEQMFEERSDDIAAATTDAIVDDLDDMGVPEPIDPPIEEIASLTANALVSDLSYAEFSSEYDAIVTTFEEDLTEFVATSGDAYVDEIGQAYGMEMSEEIPETVEDEVEALETLLVEAVTTDMSYETFVEKYGLIAHDIESAVAAYAWEHREDYADQVDAIFSEEVGTLPTPIAEEMGLIEELVMKAILTDLTYGEFEEELRDIEATLVEALVKFFFEDEAAIPTEYDATGELGTDEVDLIRLVFGATTPVAVGLFAIAGMFIGGIFLITRDPASTGLAVGVASLISGGLSFALAALLPGWIGSAIDSVDLPEGLDDQFIDLITALLSPWTTQSLVFSVVGIGLVGFGVAVRMGYIDLEGADPSEPSESE